MNSYFFSGTVGRMHIPIYGIVTAQASTVIAAIKKKVVTEISHTTVDPKLFDEEFHIVTISKL